MNTLLNIDQDYYSVGSPENIFISSSLLNVFDPDLGGHPKKVIKFLSGDTDKQNSKAIDNGNIIHAFAEDQSGFAVAEVDKPEGKIGELSDLIIQTIKVYSDISLIGEDTVYAAFVESRKFIDYYKDRSNESTFDTFKKGGGVSYVNFDISNKDKIVLTKSQKVVFDNTSDALRKHDVARSLLFELGLGRERFKEKSIFWINIIEREGKEFIAKFKSKIDNLIFDHQRKEIIITDIKTFGKGSGYNYCPKISLQDNLFRLTPFEYRKVYRQLAFYGHAARQLPEVQELMNKGYTFVYKIIVVETTDLFNVYVFNISIPWIQKGHKDISTLVDQLIWHKENNLWDRYYSEYNKGLEISTTHIC